MRDVPSATSHLSSLVAPGRCSWWQEGWQLPCGSPSRFRVDGADGNGYRDVCGVHTTKGLDWALRRAEARGSTLFVIRAGA